MNLYLNLQSIVVASKTFCQGSRINGEPLSVRNLIMTLEREVVLACHKKPINNFSNAVAISSYSF